MTEQVRRWSPPQMAWSALVAIVAWSALGFSWFGHGFDWTTEGGAREMTQDALTAELSDICVAQARAAPDAAASLKTLGETSSWLRREFVEKRGWATMPGSDAPTPGVADRCANKLLSS